MAARSLRTHRTHLVGLLHLESPLRRPGFQEGIQCGVQHGMDEHGCTLVTRIVTGTDRLGAALHALAAFPLDGMLVSSSVDRGIALPASWGDTPLVLVNASDRARRHAAVRPDHCLAGYDATQRLLASGATRIACIGHCGTRDMRRLQLDGYRMALEHVGLSFDPALVRVQPHAISDATVERLCRMSRPDAFVCLDGQAAWQVYRHAMRHALHIGRDLSVVATRCPSFFGELLTPPLTAIDTAPAAMGYCAATRLMAEVAGMPQGTDTTLFHCPLLERGSVAGGPPDGSAANAAPSAHASY